MKKVLSILLAVIALCSVFTTVSFAANFTTNYKDYSQPNTTSDYAYWNGKKVVKASGTTVSEVKWMQASLNYCISSKGLNASKLDVDGSFGPASKAATIKFQQKYGLSADGSFGPATIKKMLDVLYPPATVQQNDVVYKYVTVTVDTSSMENWVASVKQAESRVCDSEKGVIVAAKVKSTKTVSWKVPKAAVYQGPGINGYVTRKYTVPSVIQYKVHEHTRNMGYGKNFYFYGGNVVVVYTCNCGYRKELMEWTIPLPDTSDAQTTQKVIQGLPQIN